MTSDTGDGDRQGGHGEIPPWAYAAVVVVDPDPSWADLGIRLAARVSRMLDPWRIDEVEHVGSTSVPGLAAKPVVDLLVPVADLAEDGLRTVLVGAGWAYVPPELDGRTQERFFVLPDGARRVAHLHVVGPAAGWCEVVRFRDRLRADRATRERYGALKRRLAVEHGGDREAYTHAKAEFIRSVLGAG